MWESLDLTLHKMGRKVWCWANSNLCRWILIRINWVIKIITSEAKLIITLWFKEVLTTTELRTWMHLKTNNTVFLEWKGIKLAIWECLPINKNMLISKVCSKKDRRHIVGSPRSITRAWCRQMDMVVVRERSRRVIAISECVVSWAIMRACLVLTGLLIWCSHQEAKLRLSSPMSSIVILICRRWRGSNTTAKTAKKTAKAPQAPTVTTEEELLIALTFSKTLQTKV